MKVCLAGGGTGGSVTPLIALAQEIRKRDKKAQFLFIGGEEGPEREIVKYYEFDFITIEAGKLRRYFSLKNITDIIKTSKGYFQARQILKKFKPQIILSAGSYIAVPVVLSGRELKIKSFIHQQDYRRGLANWLMSGFATKVTVTFRKSLRDFPKDKTICTGNPVRLEIFAGNRETAVKKFNLEKNLQTLLFIGGGTGSLALNKILAGAVDQLTKFCQIIHICGNYKKISIDNPRYHSFEFLQDDLKDALTIADLVVSRAGMSVLTELSALAKPSILIPFPKSHQVENAKMFEDAALVFRQENFNSQKLVGVVKEIMGNRDKMKFLSDTISEVLPRKASAKIVDLIWEELT